MVANYTRNRGLLFIFFSIFSLIIGLISNFPFAIYWLFSSIMFLISSLVYFSKFLLWNLGAKGEEIVIEELRKLGDRFRILNDIKLPNKGGNIDHIVIGENGIFVIETKHHKGSIKFKNGVWTQEKKSLKGTTYLTIFGDPIKQVRKNAVNIKEFISEQKIFSKNFKPWIDAIVVFTNPHVNLEVDKESTNATVVRIENLCGVIKNKVTTVKFNKAEIDQVFDSLKSQIGVSRSFKYTADVGESSWFKNYLKYIKFGLFWGILYAITATMIAQEFYFLNILDVWFFSILFNGMILFVLGKAIIDLFQIKIRNDALRLSSTHFIGYLPIFLLIGFFGSILFVEAPLEYSVELLVRLGLVALLVLIYKLFNWSLPQ
jgi:hypothetical protein